MPPSGSFFYQHLLVEKGILVENSPIMLVIARKKNHVRSYPAQRCQQTQTHIELTFFFTLVFLHTRAQTPLTHLHTHAATADSTFVRLCLWCILGKGTLSPFPTLSDESINRGLVCVARILSSTDLKDPDVHVPDG